MKAASALALRFGPLVLLVAVAIWAYSSGLLHHLTFSELGARRLGLEAYVAAHPLLSLAVYVGVFALGVALCLPVTLVLNLAGGFLFGALLGGAAAAAASTLGGIIAFLVCRTAAGDVLARLAGPRITRVQAGAKTGALALMLTMRLIPMMPFWLINIGAAVVGMGLRPFLIGTAIGILPSSFIYAALGAGLGRVFDAGGHPSAHMLLQPQVMVPLAALSLLAIGPLGWRVLRARASAAQ